MARRLAVEGGHDLGVCDQTGVGRVLAGHQEEEPVRADGRAAVARSTVDKGSCTIKLLRVCHTHTHTRTCSRQSFSPGSPILRWPGPGCHRTSGSPCSRRDRKRRNSLSGQSTGPSHHGLVHESLKACIRAKPVNWSRERNNLVSSCPGKVPSPSALGLPGDATSGSPSWSSPSAGCPTCLSRACRPASKSGRCWAGSRSRGAPRQ